MIFFFLSLFLPCISLSHPCLSNYLSLSLSPTIVSLSIFLSHPCLSLIFPSLFLSLSSLSSPSPPTHVFLFIFLSPLSLSLSLSLCVFPTSVSLLIVLSLSHSLSFYPSLSHPCLSFSHSYLSFYLSLCDSLCLFLPPLSLSLFLAPIFLSPSNPGLSSYLSFSPIPVFLSFFSRSLSPTLVSLSSFTLPSLSRFSPYLWFTLCGSLSLSLSLSVSLTLCLSPAPVSFYFFLSPIPVYHPCLSSYFSLSHPESLFIFLSLPPLSLLFSHSCLSLSHSCHSISLPSLSLPHLFPLSPTPDQLTN